MSNDMDVRSSFLPAIKSHLRSILEVKKLSLNAVSGIVGVNRATVRRWLDEKEHSFIDIHSAIVLFEHLELPMSAMFPATPWVAGDLPKSQYLFFCLTQDEQVWALSVVTSARETFSQKSRRSRATK